MMSEARPKLFTPITVRGVTVRNRVMLSPMNQHRAQDGYADDGLLVHLGKFALGGFGIIMTEATAIEPRGRVAPGDLGIWSDDHIAGLRRVCAYVKGAGGTPGVQLAHSGRKGASQRPWQGFGPLTGEDARRGEPPWPLVSPTREALGPGHVVPDQLSLDGIEGVLRSYADAAARADAAGFDVIEVHAGHGYLIASFLSPVINTRNDEYGGDFTGRIRFALKVADAVRSRWPEHKPLMFRISSVDGHPNGWKIEDSIMLARELKAHGVDIIDCSSGGLRQSTALENAKRYPGYQVEYAARIRRGAGIATAAVGLILDGRQAEDILANEEADFIALGRQALYDPFWVHHAAQEFGVDPDFASWDVSAGWWLAKRKDGLASIGLDGAGKRMSSIEYETKI
ncbi:MAG: NADH:flavin oxidoreductase/NADH oxidase [Xanthobacteraceae bacterium]|nr:NADH:flavin oxidoreductase/NADH oxidase [Xanthobacteraceae bacterium]